MADRGRDLKVSILSDVDRFDVDKPVEGLERLGEEALDAKRELDKLFDEAKRADLDKLGDEASATATKVDSAFEKIAKSSKSNLRKVDDDAGRAKKGLDGLKDEAGESGREAAASFSGGFDSVTDFMQETAAQALGGFGAVGGALGIAAAAGLGFLANKAAEAAENIKAARDSLRDLYSNQDTTGIDKTKDFFDFLIDVGADLPGLESTLRAAGVSMDEFIKAGSEGGPVLDEVQRKLRDLGGEGAGLAGFWDGNVRGAQAAFDALSQYREGATGATDDNRIMAGVLDEARLKQEAFNDEMQKLAEAKHEEALEGISAGLRDVADASDEVAQAVAEDGPVQIKAVTDALNEATEATKRHGEGVRQALQEGGAEFAAWVSEQGPEVSRAYMEGSAKERGALREAFRKNVGAQMGGGTKEGLDGSKQTVTDAAGRIYSAVKSELTGETILVPVGMTWDPGRVAGIRAEMKRRFGTIVVDVAPNVQFGAGRYIP